MESYVILWALCAAICLAIAPMKGRSSFSWAGLGFLFGPLTVLILIFMPASQEKKTARSIEKGQQVLCPFCREAVKTDAIKCKHCHSDLSQENVEVQSETASHRRLQEAIYKDDTEAVKAILATGIDLTENSLPFSHREYAELHGSQQILDMLSKA